MSLGFRYVESYAGLFHDLDAPTLDRPMRLSVTVRGDELGDVLKTRSARIVGTIEAEGLATHASIDGTVGFKISARRIPYEFRFRGDDGADYRFLGEKDLQVVWVKESIGLLPASIFDAQGREIARARLHFRIKEDGLHALRSLRFRVFGHYGGILSE